MPEILRQPAAPKLQQLSGRVAFALANIGQEAPEAVLPSVLEALQASEWYVRWAAASACGLLGEKAAAFVPRLRHLAEYDSEPKVRTVASQSLSDMSKVFTLPAPNTTDWLLHLMALALMRGPMLPMNLVSWAKRLQRPFPSSPSSCKTIVKWQVTCVFEMLQSEPLDTWEVQRHRLCQRFSSSCGA